MSLLVSAALFPLALRSAEESSVSPYRSVQRETETEPAEGALSRKVSPVTALAGPAGHAGDGETSVSSCCPAVDKALDPVPPSWLGEPAAAAAPGWAWHWLRCPLVLCPPREPRALAAPVGLLLSPTACWASAPHLTALLEMAGF